MVMEIKAQDNFIKLSYTYNLAIQNCSANIQKSKKALFFRSGFHQISGVVEFLNPSSAWPSTNTTHWKISTHVRGLKCFISLMNRNTTTADKCSCREIFTCFDNLTDFIQIQFSRQVLFTLVSKNVDVLRNKACIKPHSLEIQEGLNVTF